MEKTSFAVYIFYMRINAWIFKFFTNITDMGGMCNEVPKSDEPMADGIHTTTKSTKSAQSTELSPGEDAFYVEPFGKWTIENKCQIYWIDPKVNSEEIKAHIMALEATKIKINTLHSTEEFFAKYDECPEPLERAIVICPNTFDDEMFYDLQHSQRVLEINVFGEYSERGEKLEETFNKIKSRYTFDDILERFDKKNSLEYKSNILFGVEQDFNIINKYRMNFFAMINATHGIKARKDYVSYLNNFYQGTNQLNFSEIEAKKEFNTLKELSNNGVYFESMEAIFKSTLNPKRLAYIRWPFQDVFNFIKKEYETKKPNFEEAYGILEVNESEIPKLKVSEGRAMQNNHDFVLFPCFFKASTNQKTAKQLYKKVKKQNPSAMFVKIELIKEELDKDIDFGYCQLSQNKTPYNLIFNVMNVFQVQEVNMEDKEIFLKYGALAELAMSKHKMRTNMQQIKQNILRNFDYIEFMKKQVKNQLKVLQMEGYYKESIEVCEKMINAKEGNKKDEMLMNLGDSYLLDGKADKAEESYKKVSAASKLKNNIKLADLYVKTEQEKKAVDVIKQIKTTLKEYEKADKVEEFYARNLVAVQQMNDGQLKEAAIAFKNLQTQMSEYFSYSYEGVPLYHEVQRNRAACQTKLNKNAEALSLLQTTLKWQQSCEGFNSPRMIATGSLLRSVHSSMGETGEVSTLDKKIKTIRRNTSRAQALNLSRLETLPKIVNQSLVNINLSS